MRHVFNTCDSFRPSTRWISRLTRKNSFNFVVASAEIQPPISLGLWGGIQRSRRCPFCRLVVHTLTAYQHLTPASSIDEVLLRNELSWKLGIELSPYDRNKSESYSNKYDLRSKAKHCSTTAYRLLVYTSFPEGENKGPLGIIQYLAHKEKYVNRRQFFGRKIDADRIDTTLLKTWLKTCTTWHRGTCNRNSHCAVDSSSLNLRLVDVKRRCVVKVTKDEVPDYIALSYVWGSAIMKKETGMEPAILLQKDIRHDAEGQEMTPLRTVLPKTIADAIVLTDILGYRY